MADMRTIFADGLLEANVSFGVARLTLAQTGGDGTPFPAGQLIVPLVQLPALANGIQSLLRQIETRVKESQQGAAAQPAAESVPAGAFRFSG